MHASPVLGKLFKLTNGWKVIWLEIMFSVKILLHDFHIKQDVRKKKGILDFTRSTYNQRSSYVWGMFDMCLRAGLIFGRGVW